MPLISVFDTTLNTVTNNIPIDTSTYDNALSGIKQNFFRMTHDINLAKRYLTEHKQDIADNVGNIGNSLGTIAAYQLGLLIPSRDQLKQFNFKFNDRTPINLSFNLPSFDIYDLPPGVEVIDYVPKVKTSCDYLDGNILFPGVPCAPPEVIWCSKQLTKKVLGKRVNLGTIPYPCGVKQKTIGGIVLEKFSPSNNRLFHFPGFDFKCVGSFNINGEMIVDMESGLPIDLFIQLFKGFDLNTYNSVTDSDKNPITNIHAVLKTISVSKAFQWFLDFAKYAMIRTPPSVVILAFTISSIKISCTATLDRFSATYGSNKLFDINNLSYRENNFELLQNGQFIETSITATSDIEFRVGLGSFRIGQLFASQIRTDQSTNQSTNQSTGQTSQTDEIVDASLLFLEYGDYGFLGLIMIMIITEKARLKSGIRFRELDTCLNVINRLLAIERASLTSFQGPNIITMLTNIKTKVDLFISIHLTPIPVPLCMVTFGTKVYFTFGHIIEFIKQYLADFIILAAFGRADMLLATLNPSVIEDIINPISLPGEIYNSLARVNSIIEYGKNIVKGYITLSILETAGFLDNFVGPDGGRTYSYIMEIPFIVV